MDYVNIFFGIADIGLVLIGIIFVIGIVFFLKIANSP